MFISNQSRLWLIVLVFLSLVSANLFAPFYADDYFQQLLLNGDASLERDNDASLYGLFSFVSAEESSRQEMQQYGVLPWFAAEEFQFRFWRPIAELSHQADHLIAANNAAFAHAHSIAWFLLLAFLVCALAATSFKKESGIALIAFAIFILDGQHVATIHWIANRNLLIAGCFMLLALWAFIRWREQQKVFYCAASLLAFAMALLSSESAIALCIYIICYSFFVEKNSIKQIAKSSWPYLLLATVWLLLYQYLGFGAHTAEGLYINPISELPAFMLALLQRFPVYFAAALLPIPAGAPWILAGASGYVLWAISAVLWLFVWLVCYGLWRYIKPSTTVKFWFVAGMLAVIPACTALTQDRLSLLQTIGVDIALAAVICALWHSSKGLKLFTIQRSLLVALLLIHLLLSPLHLLAGSFYMSKTATDMRDRALSFAARDTLENKTVVVLQMPIGEAVSLLGIRQFHHYVAPKQFIWFASNEQTLQVKQLDAHRLLLEKITGFGSGFEAAFGNRDFKVGQKISLQDMDILVKSLTSDGLPQQIEVHFKQPLDDQSMRFYQWQQGQLQPVTFSGIQ